MPSERYTVVELPYHVQESITIQPQAKLCAYCHATLVDPTTAAFHDNQVICAICRERPPHPHTRDSAYPHRQRSHEALNVSNTRRTSDPLPAYDTALTEPTYVSFPRKPPALACNTVVTVVSPHRRQQPHYVTSFESNDIASNNRSQQRSTAAPYPNPLVDITRLRIRSYAHQCLYAGAVFEGTQKSGRNSYDVHVTIVDVNFAASSLCGYLRIRGLTDDWPELTTYFDAEIIGSRYGFLTQNWGASRHEDIVHWSRFPSFKHVQHEAKLPHMTIDDRDRGVVFMRWKERFLVPDHRVQDINGASFAGFYYVCVDFNPQPSSAQSLPDRCSPVPLGQNGDKPNDPNLCTLDFPNTDARQCRRNRNLKRRSSPHVPAIPLAATMSGFYYHQNSEPYQQLSLAHVPEQTSSSFEFR